MHIIISRTDSIGDVVLTLPLAGLLRNKYSDITITFIGRSYTKAVVELSPNINHFVNWDEFEKKTTGNQAEKLRELQADWILHIFPNKQLAKAAKKAGIKNRAGTSHRTYHWFYCNILVSFSRRKSDLHEAQLNCKLLQPLGIEVPDLKVIPDFYGFRVKESLQTKVKSLLDPHRKNIVLHPKSKGSAREWGLDNFDKLVQLLPEEQFKLFVSGTSSEAELMIGFLKKNKHRVTDITGKLNLEEFIAFLSLCDGIVACSTGPLHLAAALGTTAIGIFPPIRPMHPGRWAPLGKKAQALVKETLCNECRKSSDCHCIREISAGQVKESLLNCIS